MDRIRRLLAIVTTRKVIVFVVLIVTLVTAVANGFSLLFRLAYALALGLALSYLWTWLNVRWLRVHPEHRTERLQVGQTAEKRITVWNLGWLPKLWLEVRDNADLPQYQGARITHLPAGQMRSWRMAVPCTQRGRFTLGPVTVISGDPFGLFRRERTLGGTHSLLVYPATVPLPNFSLPPAELPGEGRYRRRTHFVTPNASGVREYTFGDSFNRIHWPTTARTGRLIVKEFELDPGSEVWLLLDLQQSAQAGQGPEGTEEYGVTIAASVAKRYLEANRSVGLIAYGKDYTLLRAERGGQQLAKVLEALALAKAEGTASLGDVMLSEMKYFGRYTTTLIITPSTDENWVHALHHFTRRGTRVAAVMIEPSSFGAGVSTLPVFDTLLAEGIPAYLVKRGDALDQALDSSSAALLSRGVA